jgi:hypothetical protein
MKHDPGHAIDSLKESLVVEQPPGYCPSGGTPATQGYFPTLCCRRLAYPWRDAKTRTRISLFTESVLQCEPFFGLAALVGAREPCG